MTICDSKAFENAPLITPEMIFQNPHDVLTAVPGWVLACGIIDGDEPLDAGQSHSVAVALGEGGKEKGVTVTLAALALFCEAGRFGHTVVTNDDGRRPDLYVKWSPRGAAKDTMPLWRIIAGAEGREAVTTIDIASDLRPGNLRRYGAGAPEKAAQDLFLGHTERQARERVNAGQAPDGFDLDAYLENIRRLMSVVEMERTGVATDPTLAELAGLSPTKPEN